MMSQRCAKDGSRPASADNSRRSFFIKLGAGASGALAATAGLASGESADETGLSLQLARLEDEKILRRLHRSYEQALDSGHYADVVDLFAGDAEVVFNGGLFDNRGGGVRRIVERFRLGKTGKHIEPAPGFPVTADTRDERIEVSADRLAAVASFPYSIQVGVPIQTESSLASMARLHGEGVKTWWEGGFYAVIYRRRAVTDAWKIGRLEYRTQSRADYRPGKSHAGPIAVAPIATVFPDDPLGPDALV